jgi:DNA-directed RNA polymerase specialized sigma24 family protein
MSNCMTCFGRGTVIGSDGKPKPCPNCSGFTPETSPEAAAFTGWHRQYHRMVLRIAAAQLRYQDAALAEDIAQEVWLRVWAYLVQGAQIQSPASLFAAITRRVVVDHYRAAAARPATRAVDDTDRLVAYLTATGSAEDVASARMAARDRLGATLPWRRRHAPRQTERLLALAVAS